ncbi:MAG: PAS domain-containing protein [Deltaproteobacteria bacterium]
MKELEQELLYTKENLQATLEESQASNEELKSANEELQSTNEELQSTNEELETSKEEIQSVNEELLTVNSELQAKIEQLAGLQNDMKNLLDNTNIGTIFIDENLSIRRFSREAVKVYRLLSTDIGRPLSDIKSNIDGIDLVEEAQAVLASLVPREREVWTTGRDCYLVRVMPYRTLDNVIEGVVMTFTDVTSLKKAEDEILKAKVYAENIVDTIREPLIVLDAELKVLSASRAFYQTFKLLPGDAVGRYLYELGGRQWAIPKLRELLETVLPREASFDDFEVEHDFQGIGRRKLMMNARCVLEKTGHPQLILLAIEDITDRTA